MRSELYECKMYHKHACPMLPNTDLIGPCILSTCTSTRGRAHARQYTYLLLIDAIARGQQSEAAADVLEQHIDVVERRRETKGAHVREPRGAGRRLIEQKEQ